MGDDGWTSIRVKNVTAEALRRMGAKNYDTAIQHLIDKTVIDVGGQKYIPLGGEER